MTTVFILKVKVDHCKKVAHEKNLSVLKMSLGSRGPCNDDALLPGKLSLFSATVRASELALRWVSEFL